ncbi:WD40 repeat-like protein [Sanghuangporus baumii]|uniref:WD40 repeat-like protein n=1 Tax=Sanghuangporus baumii TaxID=108892 RepID=A0A9Q5I4H6_SANBA|nr:WD40 repeat-like protein [Sanghuangporus baumii]
MTLQWKGVALRKTPEVFVFSRTIKPIQKVITTTKMSEKDKEQYALKSPPFDSISSVKFSPTNPTHLLASSWDTTVRFYDVTVNEQRCKFDHRAAVLDCCFSSDGMHGFSGGLDTSVREFDLETENFRHLGQHDSAVSRLVYAKPLNQVISGSWDRTLRFWDSRAPNALQSTHSLPERVYGMDISGTTLVVAMASRLFHIYDVRRMDSPAQVRESSLKFLTRGTACMADGQGYAVGSVEGRISVEFFDPSPEAQKKKYAFKCHRQSVKNKETDKDEEHVWPVNTIAFHPVYNTFASGGSDGTVSLWDHESRKRLRQVGKYPEAINSLAFNCDGTRLAIAVSYNWDKGPAGLKAFGESSPKIWVQKLHTDYSLKDGLDRKSFARRSAVVVHVHFIPFIHSEQYAYLRVWFGTKRLLLHTDYSLKDGLDRKSFARQSTVVVDVHFIPFIHSEQSNEDGYSYGQLIRGVVLSRRGESSPEEPMAISPRGRCVIGEGMVNVAVKCLRFYLKKDIRTLFEKEIHVWSKLRHENFLSLLGYAFDAETGFPLLVSEWMDNGSAWNYANLRPEDSVFNLVFGIANGLAYLHLNGVVHSDIKADNVLVSSSGDALICDFGCSRMIAVWRTLVQETHGKDGGIWNDCIRWNWHFVDGLFAKLSDFQVLTALLEHATSSFPTLLPNDFHYEEIRILRAICTACWRRSPQYRPDMSWILHKISDSPVSLQIQSDLQAHTRFGECTAVQTDSGRLSDDRSYSGFELTELISAIDSEFSCDGKSTIIESGIEGSPMSSDPLLQIVDMTYRAIPFRPARSNSGSACQTRKPRRKEGDKMRGPSVVSLLKSLYTF